LEKKFEDISGPIFKKPGLRVRYFVSRYHAHSSIVRASYSICWGIFQKIFSHSPASVRSKMVEGEKVSFRVAGAGVHLYQIIQHKIIDLFGK